MTLYLLDANVLITADAQYYEMHRVPEFWAWLAHQAEQGNVKLPQEIYEEITAGKGALVDWLKDTTNKKALLLDEELDPTNVSQVIAKGYAPDLNDKEIEVIGRDPFLIAHALLDQSNRCVVTTEVSRPSAQRHNRKVPDVCNTVGVNCINAFDFVRRLDFKTSWKK